MVRVITNLDRFRMKLPRCQLRKALMMIQILMAAIRAQGLENLRYRVVVWNLVIGEEEGVTGIIITKIWKQNHIKMTLIRIRMNPRFIEINHRNRKLIRID